MAKNFKELRGGMSAAAKAASAVEHRRLVEEMSLLQLRKARELTQTRIADELHMGQGDVSKLERRTDMYVSTLASYLQAVGADLEIRAVFPDGRAVKITQFSGRIDIASVSVLPVMRSGRSVSDPGIDKSAR